MNIEINVPNIELFAKALNNAIITYGDLLSSIEFNLEIPNKYQGLADLPYSELLARFNCLVDFYDKIERIEKEYNK